MLKKNTAHKIFFTLVEASTGAPLTGANPTAYVSKDGGSQAAAAGTITELGHGQYRFDGTAADFNADHIGLVFIATNGVPAGFSVHTTPKTVAELNDLTAAQVNAEADAALADVGLTSTVTGRIDAAISTRLATAGYTAPANSDIAAIKAKTDNLPANPAAVGSNMGTVLSVTNPVTVGTNNDKTGYSISGTKTTLDALNDITAASVWAVSPRTLSSFGSLVADIVNGVWDENLASHATAGTTGAALAAAGNAGDPWAAVLPGSYTGNQAGARLVGIQGKTDLIVTGSVNVQSPVTVSGDVHLYRGDSYDDSESRSIDWTSTDWPTLTGATIKLFVDVKSEILEFAGTHNAGVVTVELTAAQTGSLPAGSYNYALRAVLPNANVITLATGALISKRVP